MNKARSEALKKMDEYFARGIWGYKKHPPKLYRKPMPLLDVYALVLWKILRYSDPTDVVLDLGCGTGDFLYRLSLHGFASIGLDLCERAVKIAKEKYREKIHLVICDASFLPVRESSCNLCTSFFLLEHTPTPFSIVKEIYRVLKVQGRAYVVYEVGNRLRPSSPEILSWTKGADMVEAFGKLFRVESYSYGGQLRRNANVDKALSRLGRPKWPGKACQIFLGITETLCMVLFPKLKGILLLLKVKKIG